MSLKSIGAKIFANIIVKRIHKWASNPVAVQKKVLHNLISEAKNTSFGKDHNFSAVTSYHDFCNRVPVRDYEALKPYVDRVVRGDEDVLWPGKPL